MGTVNPPRRRGRHAHINIAAPTIGPGSDLGWPGSNVIKSGASAVAFNGMNTTRAPRRSPWSSSGTDVLRMSNGALGNSDLDPLIGFAWSVAFTIGRDMIENVTFRWCAVRP